MNDYLLLTFYLSSIYFLLTFYQNDTCPTVYPTLSAVYDAGVNRFGGRGA